MQELNRDELHRILGQIEDYPVSGVELANKAEQMGASEDVVDFFESIPTDLEFQTEGEIVSLAEQSEDPDLTVQEGE